MAGANYQVKLSFISDSKSVRTDLQSLQQQLNGLVINKDLTQGLSPKIQAATKDVIALKIALQQATDVDTGKINFSKFNSSLKSQQLSLTQLRMSMQALGADGEKAFGTLARSIVQAEIPARSMGALMDSLWTSLKNTAKWQFSSSLLRGFTSSIREALSYAQNLDKALTNIKIVSEKSSDDLEIFARKANKAAKLLNTTTTEYAEAALIFFQQGLVEEEIEKRTAAVIKMANVTGESVEQVSSYMTAIWNNFDDGSKSLEHYADVITKLGAATASSSEEIAGGLEKFAAIAETIGLSYEYAATALATVVAETRQSEDTVGTAFKTIFGRLQSLNLGETLDDDTTLSKYSNALAAVGVHIKDSKGELKQMDQILDEIGAKWQTLSRDEQVALANTVAGTRQYSNFIALMDTYQDEFQTNLQIAREANGELDKQADEYAESWEASKKRVKNAAQGIYDALLNEKFFIEFNKGLSGLLEILTPLVNGMGGLAGILPMLSSILLQAFGPKVEQSLRSVADYLGSMGKKAQEAALATKQVVTQEYIAMTNQSRTSGGEYTLVSDQMIKNSQFQLSVQETMFRNANRMTAAEKMRLQEVINLNNALDDQLVKLREMEELALGEANKASVAAVKEIKSNNKGTVDKLDNRHSYSKTVRPRLEQEMSRTDLTEDQINQLKKIDEAFKNTKKGTIEYTEALKELNNFLAGGAMPTEQIAAYSEKVSELQNKFQTLKLAQSDLGSLHTISTEDTTAIETIDNNIENLLAAYQRLKKTYPELAQQSGGYAVQLTKLKKELSTLVPGTEAYKTKLNQINNVVKQARSASQGLTNQLDVEEAEFKELALAAGVSEDTVRRVVQAQHDMADKAAKSTKALEVQNKQHKKLQEDLNKSANATRDWASVTVSAASAMSGLAAAFNQFRNLVDTMNNDDLSWWEKFVSVLATMGSMITSIIMSLKGLAVVKEAVSKVFKKTGKEEAKQDTENAIINEIEAQTQRDENRADAEAEAPQNKEIDAGKEEAADDVKDIAENKAKNKGSGKKAPSGQQAPKGSSTPTKGAKVMKGAGASKASTIMGGAAIAIGVAVATYAIIAAVYNQAEKAAKEARERAEQVNEAYETTKQKLEALKTTLTDYSNATDSMDRLVKGTKEWNEALSAANESARNLLSTYGNIINGRYTVDANGLIQIDQEALEDVEQAQQEDVNRKASMAKSADKIATRKELEAKQKQLQRNMDTGGDFWRALGVGALAGLGGAAVGAGAGAAMGAVGAGVGAVPGAIIGGVAGLVTGTATSLIKGFSTDSEDEAMERITKHYASLTDSQKETFRNDKAAYDDYIKALYEEGKIGKSMAEELINNREAVLDLAVSTDNLTAQNLALTKSILASEYANNEKIQNASSTDAALDILATMTVEGGSIYQRIHDELSNEYDAWFGDNLEDYVEANYGDVFKVSGNGINQKTLEIKGADGKWEKVSDEELDESEIVEYMAEYLATSSQYGATDADLEALVTQLDTTAAELAKYGGSDLSQLNAEEKKVWGDLAKNAIQGENLEILSLTREQIDKILAAGKTAGTELGDQLYDAALEYDAELRKVNQKSMQDWVDDSAERFANSLQSAMGVFGFNQAGTDFYKQALMSTYEGLEGDDQLASIAAQTNANYTTLAQGIGTLIKDRGDLIYEADITDPEFIVLLGQIATAVQQATGANISFEDLAGLDNLGDFVVGIANGEKTFLDQLYGMLSVTWVDNHKTMDTTYKDGLKESLTNINSAISTGRLTTGTALSEVSGLNIQGFIDAIVNEQMSGDDLTALSNLTGINFVLTRDDEGKITGVDLDQSKYIGSSTFSYKKDKIDFTTDYDSTYSLNQELDKAKTKYDQVAKAKDKAYGKAKLDQINAEKSALLDINTALANINAQLQVDQSTARSKLNQVLSDEGFEALYDTDGTITGYRDKKTNEIKTYNEVAEHYSQKGSTKFIDSLQDYDSITESINNNTEEMSNNLEAIDDLDFETKEIVLNLKSDAVDRALDQLEWEFDQLEGKTHKTADSLLNLNKQINENAADVANTINDYYSLLNKYNLTSDDLDSMTYEDYVALGMTEEEIARLEDMPNSIQETLSKLQDIRAQYWETIMAPIDNINSDIEDTVKQISTLTTKMDNYNNIIELIGKKNLKVTNALLTDLTAAMQTNANNALSASKLRLEGLQEELLIAQQGLKSAQDDYNDEAVKSWEEEIKKIEEKITQENANLQSSWQTALQAAATAFTQAIDFALEEMEEALTEGFGSLDYLQSAYDQQRDMADLYLENYTQVYELSKLTRTITNSINDTTSLKGKTELKKLLSQINDIQNAGTEITAHDLELMQKQYDLRVAEIALEESKNSKTQVRMTRDAEGNLSYIYTANQDAIDQAQQAYEDKLFAIQDSNSKYLKEIEGQLLNSVKTYQEEVRSIMADTSLSTTEQQAKIEQLQINFQTKQQYFAKEFNKTIASNKDLYDSDFANYAQYNNDKLTSIGNFVTTFSESTLGSLLTSFGTIDEYTDEAINQATLLTNAITTAINGYNLTIDAVNRLAGVDVESGQTFADYLDEELNGDNGIIATSNAAIGETEELVNQLSDAYLNMFNKVKDWDAEFKTFIDGVKDYSSNCVTEINKILDAMTAGVTYEGEGTIAFNFGITSMDTGGYTGAWGSEGKLAVLHQKELILNATDTENILQTVDIVRSLGDYINSIAQARSFTAGSLSPYFNTDQGLEQYVEIHADFPNAVNHSEIEQAFDNLINMASQYANRK